MKDVASVVFANVYMIEQRMAGIESKLKAFAGPTKAAPAKMPVLEPAKHKVTTSGVQPFFPKELAYALQRNAEGSEPAVTANYDNMIEAAADKNGIDPALVKAVVKAESGFRTDAVSRTGAQGLMQLMPATAASLGVSDPFDPEQNIEAGTRYLKSQIDRFGSTELALAAYNAGPGNVVKYGGIPPFNETKNYVSRVMGYLNNIQSGK